MKMRIIIVILAILNILSAPLPAAGLTLDLNDAERQWLADHPRIDIGVMSDWPPLNFIDQDGKPQGIGADYIAAINRQLGGAITIHPAPFNENYDRVKNGRLDALMDITSKPEREPFFYFTKPYIRIPHTIVGRKSGPHFNTAADLAGKTVALERGFYAVTYFRKNHPDVTTREYTSTSDALDAVARGEADAYVGNRAVAIHLIEKDFHNNLRLMGKFPATASVLQFGVARGNPLLVSILDKALQAIPESEHSAIFSKWIGLKYKQGLDYALFWKIMAGAAALLALVLFWNLRLGREVRARKTAEAELLRYRDHLEELVRERSATLELKNLELEREITEHKRDIEALDFANQCFTQALNSPQHVLYRLNVKKKCYDYLSPTIEHFTGHPVAEFRSNGLEKLKEYLHPDDSARIFALIDKAFLTRGGETSVNFDFEYRLRKADGGYCWLHDSTTACFSEQGELECFYGSVLDVTARKAQDEELSRAKEAAEAASLAKGCFLANMSHELRTPMTGVIGLTELLLRTELTAEQRKYAELVLLSGRNMVQLLSDILDFSKIEKQKLELELRDFDLQDEIAGIIAPFSFGCREKGLEFVSQIDPDVPLRLKGDPVRLRQIITNLIGNAIKFTAKGFISLHIVRVAEDDRQATLRFQVQDSGIGIAADKLEMIFEPFTQADLSSTRKFGGTGLGLSIARLLVEMMGGRVGVESVEDVGTTFWFTVVLEKQDCGASQWPGPVDSCDGVDTTAVGEKGPATNLRLLLAEDDPTTQNLIELLLTHSGYGIDVVSNGAEALQALETHDYNLVLMDCMMPVMNGCEATAVIRDRSSKVRDHDVPVIALTGNALRGEDDKCLAAGMNDYLSKPFYRKELLAMIEKWTRL